MNEAFKIYIERLREKNFEKIEESFAPLFLDVHEGNLNYQDPIIVSGEAYLAEDELILKWNIATKAVLPCIICTEPVRIDVVIKACYQAIPLAEIKGGIFNFKNLLREAVILETPSFAECEGKCPRRQEVVKFLKKESSQGKGEDSYLPFSNLKWDKKKDTNS